MTDLFNYAIWFAQSCCLLALVFASVRAIRGPAAQDRVLAFDAMYVSGMSLLLILGIKSSSTAYFDMALLIALFGFVSTVALSKFLLRGEVIEP